MVPQSSIISPELVFNGDNIRPADLPFFEQLLPAGFPQFQAPVLAPAIDLSNSDDEEEEENGVPGPVVARNTEDEDLEKALEESMTTLSREELDFEEALKLSLQPAPVFSPPIDYNFEEELEKCLEMSMSTLLPDEQENEKAIRNSIAHASRESTILGKRSAPSSPQSSERKVSNSFKDDALIIPLPYEAIRQNAEDDIDFENDGDNYDRLLKRFKGGNDDENLKSDC